MEFLIFHVRRLRMDADTNCRTLNIVGTYNSLTGRPPGSWAILQDTHFLGSNLVQVLHTALPDRDQTSTANAFASAVASRKGLI